MTTLKELEETRKTIVSDMEITLDMGVYQDLQIELSNIDYLNQLNKNYKYFEGCLK